MFNGKIVLWHSENPWRDIVFTPEKIDEWLAEVEQRPNSAPTIIQFIANRLNDLDEWNEQLRAENTSLRSKERVQEYERQIAHLQYQLDLIKRQHGGQLPQSEGLVTDEVVDEIQMLNVLIYTLDGRLLRIEVDPADLEDGRTIGNLRGTPIPEEVPRLLAVPANEELLFLFSSGRIATTPVDKLPISTNDPFEWESASIPYAPQAGDELACLAPISRLALSDYFVQTSRRGFLKKIRTALAPSIMENQYIGMGTKTSNDQPFDLALSVKGEHIILVSKHGYLRYVPVEVSPSAIVEAMKVKHADYLVAAFIMPPDKSLLVMTQLGKAIQRTGDSLGLVTDLGRVGKTLYTKARREAGVRVVGAAAVAESDWGLALHSNGSLSIHAIAQIFANGTIPVPTGGELSAFAAFSVLS